MTLENVKALIAEKNQAFEAITATKEAAAHENRDYTADEQSTLDKASSDLQRLTNEINDAMTELESRALNDRFNALIEQGNAGGSNNAAHPQIVEERQALADFAAGKSRFVELRTLTAGTATDGAELVPTTLYDEIVEHMVEASAILSSGVTILRTSGGEDLVIPRTTSYSAAALVGENAQISASDPQFDTITLGAYKYAFLTAMSNELLTDASFNVGEFVSRQGGAALGRGVTAHLASGSGTAQPNGIDNATTGKTSAATTAVTPDEFMDLMFSVIPQYRSNGVWYMNDEIFKYVSQLKITDGTGATNQWFFSPGRVPGEPDRLMGHPIYIEPNMTGLTAGALVAAQTVAVFGDPKSYFARLVGPVRVERSDDFNFDYDVVTIRFITRADGDIVDTNGLRKLVTATV